MVIRDISHYDNRINLLRARDEVVNANIIRKLLRRKRILEKEGA